MAGAGEGMAPESVLVLVPGTMIGAGAAPTPQRPVTAAAVHVGIRVTRRDIGRTPLSVTRPPATIRTTDIIPATPIIAMLPSDLDGLMVDGGMTAGAADPGAVTIAVGASTGVCGQPRGSVSIAATVNSVVERV